MEQFPPDLKITALAGGVGGSRLVRGMAEHLSPQQLTVVVNTGDDFVHFGLPISPDLDTVLYNLADVAQKVEGWGIQNDTHACMTALANLGGDSWFRLGDRDLATHLLRGEWLREGLGLTEITGRLARALGVYHAILPMSDDPCRTLVETDGGVLEFQHYFVKERWQPVCRGLRWQGAESAQPTPQVLAALREADAVVVCPSNPFVSVDPILNLPGVRQAMAGKPVVAMSPIIGGMAVKGPAAKMFLELTGEPASVEAVAAHYGDLLAGMAVDEVDDPLVESLSRQLRYVRAMPTLMLNREKQIEVAADFLAFVAEIVAEERTARA
jgi:LPPG:FO 2-phospho-L-lactate transferase